MTVSFIALLIFSSLACTVKSTVDLEAIHRQISEATERDMQFTKLSYDSIIETFNDLKQRFPGYIRVHDAVEEFTALNRTLPKTRCFFTGTTERACKFIYAELTNFSNPEHVNFTQSFFSGNFHGDETVGPNVVTYLAKYILEQPYADILNYSYIVLLPLGNPSGYFDVSREERQYSTLNKNNDKTIDMNRDFPYDRSSSTCFKTAGARVVNYIWQNHLFTAAITFHGGMTAIGWPWGSNNHAISTNIGHLAPDHQPMFTLAKKMQLTARSSYSIPEYPIDTLTNGIYAVSGTFEDWSYAASWENQFDLSGTALPKCSSVSKEENFMDENIARSLTYLIETSSPHNPREETYGNWKEVADPAQGIGNVSRNIRLTLEFIENLTPFHKIKFSQSEADSDTVVSWELNGCETVDRTRVYIREQADSTLNEENNPQKPIKDNYLTDAELTNDGFKLFKEIKNYHGSLMLTKTCQNLTIDLDHNVERKTKLEIVLVSSCDSSWTKDFFNAKPTRIPQSHFARRIKDENYLAQNHGFSINSKARIVNSYSSETLLILKQQQQQQPKQLPKEQDIETPLPAKNQQAGQEQYLFILGGVLLIGAGVSLIVYIAFRRLRQNNIQFKEIQDEELQNSNPHSHHQQKASVFLMGKDTRENAAHFGI